MLLTWTCPAIPLLFPLLLRRRLLLLLLPPPLLRATAAIRYHLLFIVFGKSEHRVCLTNMARANACSFQILDSYTESQTKRTRIVWRRIKLIDHGDRLYLSDVRLQLRQSTGFRKASRRFARTRIPERRIERPASSSSSRIECDSIAHQRTEAIQQSSTQ